MADSPWHDLPQPLRQVLDGSSAGIAVLDTGLRYRYVNPALARMNGVPAELHLGRTIAQLLPDIDAREDVLRAVLADGRPREVTSSGHTRAAGSPKSDCARTERGAARGAARSGAASRLRRCMVRVPGDSVAAPR